MMSPYWFLYSLVTIICLVVSFWQAIYYADRLKRSNDNIPAMMLISTFFGGIGHVVLLVMSIFWFIPYSLYWLPLYIYPIGSLLLGYTYKCEYDKKYPEETSAYKKLEKKYKDLQSSYNELKKKSEQFNINPIYYNLSI